MTGSTLIVLSNPVDGREEEYNDWYTNRHLSDVLQVPGIVSATRLKLVGEPIGAKAWRYCAFYNIEHEEPGSVLEELQARVGTDKMPVSGALDFPGLCAAVYAPFVSQS